MAAPASTASASAASSLTKDDAKFTIAEIEKLRTMRNTWKEFAEGYWKVLKFSDAYDESFTQALLRQQDLAFAEFDRLGEEVSGMIDMEAEARRVLNTREDPG